MLRTRFVTGSVLALTLTLGVAGCSLLPGNTGSGAGGSNASSPAATPTAAPATGDTVKGTGYSYVVPKSWEEQDKALAASTDTIALDSKLTGDFSTNVNVVISSSGAASADLIEPRIVKELTGGGATNAKVRERLTIAGAESAHVAARLTNSGVTYNVQQYYIPHDSSTYVVTFSFATTVPDGDSIDIAESVLATWKWS